MLGGFLSKEEAMEYMPSTNPKKVDRHFVWDVYQCLHPEGSAKYYQSVLDEKAADRELRPKKPRLQMDESVMDMLLKYDHQPSKSWNNQLILLF